MLRGALELLTLSDAHAVSVSTFGDPKRDREVLPQHEFVQSAGQRRSLAEGVAKALAVLALRTRAPALTGWGLSALRSMNPDAMDRISRADALVVTGGPFFKENRRLGVSTGNLFVALLEPYVAMALRKPLYIVGQEISPRYSVHGRALLGPLIRYASYVAARDRQSMSRANALVDGERVTAMPDLAFAAPVREAPAPRRQVAVNIRTLDQAQLAALCLKTGLRPGELVDVLQKQYEFAIREIARRDAAISFVFLNQAKGNDGAIGRKIADAVKIDPNRIVVQEDGTSADALYEAISESEFCITMRYHSTLLAIKAGTPMVAVGYDPKVERLMRENGLGSHVIVEMSQLGAQVVDAFERRGDWRRADLSQVEVELAAVRAQLRRAGEVSTSPTGVM